MRDAFVRFEAGGDLYALPLLEVREVIEPTELTPIPHAPASTLGVMNHHGRVVTLVDLCALLHGEPPAPPQICLLLQDDERRVALGVTRVEGIGPLDESGEIPRLGDRAVTLLSATQVFAAYDLSFERASMVESTPTSHRERSS